MKEDMGSLDIYTRYPEISEQQIEDMVQEMAAETHAAYIAKENPKNTDGSEVPRLRKLKAGDEEWAMKHPDLVNQKEEIDIAVPFSELSPGWQAENREAARSVIQYVVSAIRSGEKLNTSTFEFLGAKAVHEEWMKRVKPEDRAYYESKEMMKDYESLKPEIKQTDIDKLHQAIRMVRKHAGLR